VPVNLTTKNDCETLNQKTRELSK